LPLRAAASVAFFKSKYFCSAAWQRSSRTWVVVVERGWEGGVGRGDGVDDCLHRQLHPRCGSHACCHTHGPCTDHRSATPHQTTTPCSAHVPLAGVLERGWAPGLGPSSCCTPNRPQFKSASSMHCHPPPLAFTCCRMSSMLVFSLRLASSRSPGDMAEDKALSMPVTGEGADRPSPNWCGRGTFGYPGTPARMSRLTPRLVAPVRQTLARVQCTSPKHNVQLVCLWWPVWLPPPPCPPPRPTCRSSPQPLGACTTPPPGPTRPL
jgi:hypothetical protein